METPDSPKPKTSKKPTTVVKNGGSGLWFLGFVGTLVYFLHYHSGTFALVCLAVLKALFWPAFLAYYVLRFMHV